MYDLMMPDVSFSNFQTIKFSNCLLRSYNAAGRAIAHLSLLSLPALPYLRSRENE